MVMLNESDDHVARSQRLMTSMRQNARIPNDATIIVFEGVILAMARRQIVKAII